MQNLENEVGTPTAKRNWYNTFSGFYDRSLEKLYRESRIRAVELLDIKPESCILDVACGTGANLPHLQAKMGSANTLYGTDFSAGMLKRAKEKVDAAGWKNVVLLQQDARKLSISDFENAAGKKIRFDRIICFLGLSVIPDWQAVTRNLINMLEPGGKIVIADVYAEKRTLQTWLVEKIAKADLNRMIWTELENNLSDFHKELLPAPEKKVGGQLYAAAGTKK